jgi:release factor glutamine methyltransferase
MATIQELQKKFLPALAPEDFFVLLAHTTDTDKIFLLTHPEYTLSEDMNHRTLYAFERRLKREPVAYITGHKEFYGRDFQVDHATLIPRPETEIMVERVLETISKHVPSIPVDIIDLGTGSGNIIITLACELPSLFPATHFSFTGTDISSQALLKAKENAGRHNRTSLITFLESDLFKGIPLSQKKDHACIIIANLPYLSTDIYNESDPDVRDYEPKSALESGILGLDHYERLLEEIKNFSPFFSSTKLFLEISPEQSPLIKKIVARTFPQSSLTIFNDLSGRARIAQITL